MDNEFLDDFEREQAVKKWMKTNVPVIIIGALIGLAGIYGWKHYQTEQLKHRLEASAIFQDIKEIVASPDNDDPTTLVDKLKTDYIDTSYAVAAELLLTIEELEQKNLEAATTDYEWIKANVKDETLKHIVDIRYARLLVVTGDSKPALAILDRKKELPGFVEIVEELRGDIFVAEGNYEEARAAYQNALDESEGTGAIGNQQFLQMKYDDLPIQN